MSLSKYSQYPGLADLKVDPPFKDYILMMLDQSAGAIDRIKPIDCSIVHPGMKCHEFGLLKIKRICTMYTKMYAILLLLPWTIKMSKKLYNSRNDRTMTIEERLKGAARHLFELVVDYARAVFSLGLITACPTWFLCYL